MELSPNQSRAIRQTKDELRRKVESACQADGLDDLIVKLTEVWAANTRAVQLAMRIRDEAREQALQEIAA